MTLIYWAVGILIAFSIPAAFKMLFPKEITNKEFLLSSFISIVIMIGIFFFLKMNATHDTEILNGQVTKKYSEEVSCQHSYSCLCVNVCSGSGTNQSCTQVCQTCYDHDYDIDWVVKSDVGESIISRVDRQGTKEPPRWSNVVIGEPFSAEYSFVNYIKASPDSLFSGSKSLIQQYAGQIPEYPTVNDYYKYNRVILKEVSIPNTLNQKINEFQKKWGPKKQINVILFFVSEKYTQEYFKAVEASWLGGKKNDTIIITQLDNQNNINWSRVISRSENKSFDKSVEFDIGNLKTFNEDTFLEVLDKNIMERFNRENFEKYSYLMNEFTPSGISIFIGLLASILINITVAFFAIKEDWFGENRYSYRR